MHSLKLIVNVSEHLSMPFMSTKQIQNSAPVRLRLLKSNENFVISIVSIIIEGSKSKADSPALP